jgi:hypothetical protein
VSVAEGTAEGATAGRTEDPAGDRSRSWRVRLAPYVNAAEIELAVLLTILAAWNILAAARGGLAAFVGWDFEHYVDAARRWVDTGTPYLAHEVAGPFQFADLTFLHPPISLLLFAPFLVLPGVLFWLVPLVGTAAIIATWQPARWTWPVMALQLNWPRFTGAVLVGNTDLWVVFFIAAGLRFGWPVLLLVLKPSIAPFAIVDVAALLRADAIPVRRWREIALAAALVLVMAAPFGGLWLDWLAVVRHSPADPLYSVAAIPWLSIPVVAWIARRRYRRRSDVDPDARSSLEDRDETRQRERDRDNRRAGDQAEVRVGSNQ